MTHRLSCARGIFPDQGLNSHLLHWQTDSLPLSHQESLVFEFIPMYVHGAYVWLCLQLCIHEINFIQFPESHYLHLRLLCTHTHSRATTILVNHSIYPHSLGEWQIICSNPLVNAHIRPFLTSIIEQCTNEHPFTSLSPESKEHCISCIVFFISYILFHIDRYIRVKLIFSAEWEEHAPQPTPPTHTLPDLKSF